MRLIATVAALSLLAACATNPGADEPSGPANLAAAAGAPAPPQARLYADCIAAAAAANSIDRENNTLRFHCSGASAQRFYDGLAVWSAARGAELTDADRTLRFTARPRHDIVGLDYCWADAAGGYGCTVVLNVGEYLNAE